MVLPIPVMTLRIHKLLVTLPLLFFGIILSGQAQAATTTSAIELGLLFGQEIDEGVGKGVASAGDVDGDGYDDLLIGAPGSGESAPGAVYLVYGNGQKIDDYDLIQAVQFQGEDTSDKLGSTVTGLGDINGDGYADMGLTSLYHDGSKNNPGTLYIIYGQAERFVTQSVGNFPDYQGLEDNIRLASVVTAVGDINLDGYDDFVIGAANRSDRSGGVYLVYGQATKLTGGTVSSFVLLSGDNDFDYAGWTIGGGGDVNADGFPDMLISAPKYNLAERDEGMVYLIYGRSTRYASADLKNVAAVTISGQTTSERIGQSLTLTDLNADGFADSIIGAAYNDSGAPNGGAVYILYGSAALATELTLANTIRLYSTGPEDIAGFAVTTPGDITTDGYPDLIVGAPSLNEVEPGKVFLVTGGTTLLTTQVLSNFDQIQGETFGDQFGYDVASTHDTNHDGRAEVLVGASNYGQSEEGGGAVYIMYWPVLTCDNSAALGGILANYPTTDWKLRNYKANSKLKFVVERKGQQGFLVNCKTDQIVQTLTFNTKAQRKILARVFQTRRKPVLIVVTRTHSRRKIKVFFYKQQKQQLKQLDYFTTKWRPRGLRIKLKKKNHVVLQKGQEKKHRLVYWIDLDMHLQRIR